GERRSDLADRRGHAGDSVAAGAMRRDQRLRFGLVAVGAAGGQEQRHQGENLDLDHRRIVPPAPRGLRPPGYSSVNPSLSVTWKWPTVPLTTWPRVSTTSNQSMRRIVSATRATALRIA